MAEGSDQRAKASVWVDCKEIEEGMDVALVQVEFRAYPWAQCSEFFLSLVQLYMLQHLLNRPFNYLKVAFNKNLSKKLLFRVEGSSPLHSFSCLQTDVR